MLPSKIETERTEKSAINLHSSPRDHDLQRGRWARWRTQERGQEQRDTQAQHGMRVQYCMQAQYGMRAQHGMRVQHGLVERRAEPGSGARIPCSPLRDREAQPGQQPRTHRVLRTIIFVNLVSNVHYCSLKISC